MKWILVCMTVLTANAFAEVFPKRSFPIDENVNPCANFYEYACNQTIQKYKLPPTRSRHNFSFDDTKEWLLEYKKNYFKQLRSGNTNSRREQQIHDFYAACMNETAAVEDERQYVSRLLNRLANIQNRQQFTDLLFEDLKSGKPSYFSFWANLPNFKNSQKMDGYFQIELLTLPETSYYEKADVLADLRPYIEKFFTSIGMDRPADRASWVYQFERKFAPFYPTDVEINKRVFSLTQHTAALSKKLVRLRLGEFVDRLPNQTHVRNILGDGAFEFMEESLGQMPLEQLKSIYIYHVLRKHLDDAYPEFRKVTTEFSAKHFGGSTERPDRQERCTNEVMTKFGMELDSILLPQLFPNFPKEKLSAMVEKIRAGLIRSIRKNVWLSPPARQAAALKLERLNIRLVAPESEQEWNFNKIGDYSKSTLTQNRLLHHRLKFQKGIEDLKKSFLVPVWSFGPLEVNAALLPTYNAIIFPIAILQPPFYDPVKSEELNMAGIGSVIGHELGHAIDDKGYTFDYRGRINPWIKKTDEEKFFARAQPLIEQFDKTGHNGKFTLGENIGDLVGLTNAYEVSFPAGTDKAPSLKREFFTQYARIWCEVQTPGIAELRKKTDPHSLGFARTNEQVKHQPAFAEAFGCRSTDPMVLPANEVIRIW